MVTKAHFEKNRTKDYLNGDGHDLLLVEVLEIFRLFVDGGFEVQVIAIISLCTIVSVQLKGAVIQLQKENKTLLAIQSKDAF